jgi:hypothetical protein
METCSDCPTPEVYFFMDELVVMVAKYMPVPSEVSAAIDINDAGVDIVLVDIVTDICCMELEIDWPKETNTPFDYAMAVITRWGEKCQVES